MLFWCAWVATVACKLGYLKLQSWGCCYSLGNCTDCHSLKLTAFVASVFFSLQVYSRVAPQQWQGFKKLLAGRHKPYARVTFSVDTKGGVGESMTFRTTELQAGLLLQQVVHCCQWSTIHPGCLQWLFGGACCLGLFWWLIYVAVLSFYTGMFSVILGFSSFTAFFLVIFECLEVFSPKCTGHAL